MKCYDLIRTINDSFLVLFLFGVTKFGSDIFEVRYWNSKLGLAQTFQRSR